MGQGPGGYFKQKRRCFLRNPSNSFACGQLLICTFPTKAICCVLASPRADAPLHFPVHGSARLPPRAGSSKTESLLSITPTLPMVALWYAAWALGGKAARWEQGSPQQDRCPPLPSDHCRGKDGQRSAFYSSSCPAGVHFQALAPDYVYF